MAGCESALALIEICPSSTHGAAVQQQAHGRQQTSPQMRRQALLPYRHGAGGGFQATVETEGNKTINNTGRPVAFGRKYVDGAVFTLSRWRRRCTVLLHTNVVFAHTHTHTQCDVLNSCYGAAPRPPTTQALCLPLIYFCGAPAAAAVDVAMRYVGKCPSR